MVAPDPVAFRIFGFDVMWYGVLIGIAILLACAIACRRAPKFGIDPDALLDVLIAAIPAGVVGARAYYVAFKWDQYAGDFFKMIDIRSGGLAIHGGLLLGLACGALMCRRKGIRVLAALDLAAPSVALAQSIGRWGNFFNEEAHGGLTDFPIYVWIDGQKYHATFLYESVWCLLLGLFLLYFSRKERFQGQVFCLYVMLYSAERFCVEGLRTDSLMIGPLRQAQVLSLVLIVLAACLYGWLGSRQKREKLHNTNSKDML